MLSKVVRRLLESVDEVEVNGQIYTYSKNASSIILYPGGCVALSAKSRDGGHHTWTETLEEDLEAGSLDNKDSVYKILGDEKILWAKFQAGRDSSFYAGGESGRLFWQPKVLAVHLKTSTVSRRT